MSKLLRAFFIFISALLPVASSAIIIAYMAKSRTEFITATVVVATALSLSLFVQLIILSQETRSVSERQDTIRHHASALARCMRNLNQRVSEIEQTSSVLEKADDAGDCNARNTPEKTASTPEKESFSLASEASLEALRLARVTPPSNATNENKKTVISPSHALFDRPPVVKKETRAPETRTSEIRAPETRASKEKNPEVETIFTLPQRKPWGVEIRSAPSARLWGSLRKEEALAANARINDAVKIYEAFLNEGINLQILLSLTRDFFSDGAAIRALDTAIQQYPELSRFLFLGIAQNDVRRASANEVAVLGALAETGLKFALTKIVDVRFDPTTLRDCNVRLVQIDASVLLSNIDSGEIAEVGQPVIGQALQAQGIELLCRNVRRHDYIPELLDQQVTLVQGEALESVEFPVNEAQISEERALKADDSLAEARARWMRAVG